MLFLLSFQRLPEGRRRGEETGGNKKSSSRGEVRAGGQPTVSQVGSPLGVLMLLRVAARGASPRRPAYLATAPPTGLRWGWRAVWRAGEGPAEAAGAAAPETAASCHHPGLLCQRLVLPRLAAAVLRRALALGGGHCGAKLICAPAGGWGWHVCAEEHELAGTGWLLLEKEGQQSFEKRRAGRFRSTA